ncbi:MAG: hypothetical protein J6J42_13155 [Lachnospiraceae bacterium]|nr:hypothetical protein [Lachnospiraceae bacterium]
MHGKDFILDWLKTFFLVVTLINAAMFIMGLYFMPENRFGYEAFAAPLIYGLAGCLPNVVMYSRRELKVKELLVRKVLQLVLVEVLVLFAAFYDAGEQWLRADIIVSVAVSIFVIYVIANVFDWVQNTLSAKRMTEELLQFQEAKMKQ